MNLFRQKYTSYTRSNKGGNASPGLSRRLLLAAACIQPIL
jgi:hypothetical protein